MVAFLNILLTILSVWTKLPETYVIQTADGKLHFITDIIESHQLNIDSQIEIIEDGGLAFQETLGHLSSEQNNGDIMKNISRIERITASSDGIIDLFGRKIFLDEILVHPIVEDGIYVAATQEHHPSLINNTVVISAVIRVQVIDLYDFTSRLLRFNQILYLHEIFQNIPKKDKEIYLNGKWWAFDTKILAIYVLKENSGLNFMHRIFGKADVALYNHHKEKISPRRWPFSLPFVAIFILVLYMNRNLKIHHCIIKNKLYTGRFVKKNCLVYRGSDMFLKDHEETYGDLGNHFLVQILSRSEGWIHPAIITENTTQFIPTGMKLADMPHHIDKQIEQDALNEVSDLTSADHFIANIYNETNQEITNRLKTELLAIAKSVQHLHSLGAVCGRICPENIRKSDDFRIKIQGLFNNRGWKAIKQLKNTKSHRPDTVDDIFSLGCLFHYYLTGYHPFDLRNFIKKERRAFKKTKSNDIEEAPGELEEEADIVKTADIPKVEEFTIHQPTSKVNQFVINSKEFFGFIYKYLRSKLLNCSSQFLTILMQYHLKFGCLFLKRLIPEIVISRVGNFPYFLSVISIAKRGIRQIKEAFSDPPLAPSQEVYRKVLSEDESKYIEYNVLYDTYGIRLEDQIEHDLIYQCIRLPQQQTQVQLNNHPYFWSNERYLEFICDISDFIETNPHLKPRLERNKKIIFAGSWAEYLDSSMVKHIYTKRTYDYRSLCDLIRLIRNSHRHYQELRSYKLFETLEGKLFFYISHVFPELLMFLYRNPLIKNCQVMQEYYK